jgi:mitochondrial fission protein ELM1
LSLDEEPGLRLSARVRGEGLSTDATRELLDMLQGLCRAGGRVWVTLSPSTPVPLRAELRARLAPLGARVWESEAVDGPNPYVGRLLFSHLALVGPDDPVGAAEAAYFGLPVAILASGGKLPRWANLEIATDRARLAVPGLKPWATEPHRPVDVAADAVVAHLTERYPPARW